MSENNLMPTAESFNLRERAFAGLTFLVIAAGTIAVASRGAEAQGEATMKPTGITDINYRTDCGVPVIGDSSETTDALYVSNERETDSVVLNLSGTKPATTSTTVSLGSMTLASGEVSARIIDQGISHIGIEEDGTDTTVSIPFDCYEAPGTPETLPSPTPSQASPTPEVTISPEAKKPVEKPASKTSDTTDKADSADANRALRKTEEPKAASILLPDGSVMHPNLKVSRTG